METIQMVNAAYGDQALSRSNVFRWYERFRDGREDIEDRPGSGRPSECRNDNNVGKISQLLLQNRHLSLMHRRCCRPPAGNIVGALYHKL